jgi:hypothetical protein
MTLASTMIVLAVTAAGGLYAYSALTTTHTVIDPSVADRFKPYNPHMIVNEINYHNDPKVNKAWWDNQHRRRDGHFEDPTARNFTDRTWY